MWWSKIVLISAIIWICSNWRLIFACFVTVLQTLKVLLLTSIHMWKISDFFITLVNPYRFWKHLKTTLRSRYLISQCVFKIGFMTGVQKDKSSFDTIFKKSNMLKKIPKNQFKLGPFPKILQFPTSFEVTILSYIAENEVWTSALGKLYPWM